MNPSQPSCSSTQPNHHRGVRQNQRNLLYTYRWTRPSFEQFLRALPPHWLAYFSDYSVNHFKKLFDETCKWLQQRCQHMEEYNEFLRTYYADSPWVLEFLEQGMPVNNVPVQTGGQGVDSMVQALESAAQSKLQTKENAAKESKVKKSSRKRFKPTHSESEINSESETHTPCNSSLEFSDTESDNFDSSDSEWTNLPSDERSTTDSLSDLDPTESKEESKHSEARGNQESLEKSLSKDFPVESPIKDYPVEFPIKDYPVESPINDFPVESPIKDFPVESPIKDFLVESPIKDFPVESPVKDFPFESPIKDFPVESPIKDFPVEHTIQNFLVESPIKDFPVESPIKDFPVEYPIKDFPVESPIKDFPVASTIKDFPVESPIKDFSAESRIKDFPVESSCKDFHVESPIKDFHVESPIKDLHVESPIKDFHVESPSTSFPVESPNKNFPVESSNKDFPVESPIKDFPVESPIKDFLVESPIKDFPVEFPIKDFPFESEIMDFHVESPSTNFSVESPSTNLPVESPSTNLPVESPSTNLPVESPIKGFPVESLSTNFPVEFLSTNFPVESPSMNFPVESSIKGFPVQSSIKGFPVQFPIKSVSVEPSIRDTLNLQSASICRNLVFESLSKYFHAESQSKDSLVIESRSRDFSVELTHKKSSVESLCENSKPWFSSSADSKSSVKPIKSPRSTLLESAYYAGPLSKSFTVYQHLRTGTFGRIKRGFRNSDGLLVIVKCIRKSKIFNDIEVFDISKKKDVPIELPLLRRIDHPNIVKVLDYFENEHCYQIVMQQHGYAMDLFAFINRNTYEDEQLISYLFRQIASALSFLHDLCIVHRDVKDENCIINENFQVQLIDFGSAAIMTGEPFTKFLGTKQYCPPEILKGETYVGPEVEMYALGVTLFVLKFGRLPFNSKRQILKGDLRFPNKASDELVNLIEGLMEPDPGHRLTLPEVEIHKWVTQPVQIENYNFATAIGATEEEVYAPKYVTFLSSSESNESNTNDSDIHKMEQEVKHQSATQNDIVDNSMLTDEQLAIKLDLIFESDSDNMPKNERFLLTKKKLRSLDNLIKSNINEAEMQEEKLKRVSRWIATNEMILSSNETL